MNEENLRQLREGLNNVEKDRDGQESDTTSDLERVETIYDYCTMKEEGIKVETKGRDKSIGDVKFEERNIKEYYVITT